jgi:hypothetical protein
MSAPIVYFEIAGLDSAQLKTALQGDVNKTAAQFWRRRRT